MDCPACGHANPAGSSFCLACGSRLALRCAACGAELPGDARFCNCCGSPIDAGAAKVTGRDRPLRDADLRAYTPKHLVDKILATRSALEGERKQVTVLFADVKSSMELAESVDPEEWHRILDGFFQLLADGVHRFEGTVNQYTGDGIMALFGAPIAHEDHAQRACYAALHLREELRRYAEELKRTRGLAFAVRMGLNSGEVVVGKIGDDLRMDYTAQGPVVGTAQRMEQLADPGRIYAAEPTAKLVTGRFALRDLGAFELKGVPAPVRVHELEGAGVLRTRFEVSRSRGLSRFVGRSDEMAALEAALARANEGHGQIVGVVAEPGTGKSRLCFELLERCRARGTAVREAHGVSHGKNVPFLPVLELLRSTFDVREHDPPQAARNKIAGSLLLLDREFESTLPLFFDLLGVPDPERPSPPLVPEEQQRRLLGALRELIAARSRREPAVVLIEDLHWIDDATEAFLENVVDAIERTRTLLLVSFRPEYHARWMQHSYYQQLPLRPLGRDAAGELVRELLGADPSLGALPERIVERTAGNPFFLEEIILSLAESGTLAGGKGAYRLARPVDEIEIPATVQPLLAARIDRLAEREKQVLRAASVIGDEFAEKLLARALELPEPERAAALRGLLDAEMIYEESLYPEAVFCFKHPLTREVAYRSQLAERRSRVHGAVARALEEGTDPTVPRERAALLAHHWDEAGEALPAARWHRRATGSWITDTNRVFHHWRRVRALARELPESAERDELRATAASQLIVVGRALGRPPAELSELFAEASEDARRRGDELGLAELESNYGLALATVGGDVEEALQRLRESHDRIERAGDPGLRIASHYNLGAFLAFAGFSEDALPVLEQGLALAARIASAGADRLGAPPFLLLSLVHMTSLINCGRLSEAEEELRGFERRRGELGPFAPLVVHWIAGSIALLRGDPPAALRHAGLWLELAERAGNPIQRAAARWLLGAAHREAGDLDAAVAVLEESSSLAQELRLSIAQDYPLPTLALVHADRGDAERALDVAGHAVASGEATHRPVGRARLALARALLLRGGSKARAEVEEALARAEADARRGGMALLEAEILEARAALARVCGEADARRQLLRDAHARYAATGATGPAERVARELER